MSIRTASKSFLALGSLALAVLLCPVPVRATEITFLSSGTNPVSGQSISATVKFQVVGGALQVTLTNTGADVLRPTDVLTAVFFDITGDPALSSVSAVLAGTSTVAFGSPDPGGVVGGEWAYKRGLSGAPNGAKQGISSSGFGLFGAATFPGSNLQGPSAVGGLQYGITSGVDILSTGNTPVTGTNALIKNSVLFTLGSLPSGFSLADISNVGFQYGTSLTDPYLAAAPVQAEGMHAAPEPATMFLFGSGLTGLGLFQRRRRPRRSPCAVPGRRA